MKIDRSQLEAMPIGTKVWMVVEFLPTKALSDPIEIGREDALYQSRFNYCYLYSDKRSAYRDLADALEDQISALQTRLTHIRLEIASLDN